MSAGPRWRLQPPPRRPSCCLRGGEGDGAREQEQEQERWRTGAVLLGVRR